ncbi:BMP family ABC transporter substrate-binding protein [Mycoplasmopsis lipofaciens]|uniref:BMP family ABC transporter substrate-binding protein n=1 Tax=Mycoplasmopsis lipofaciens TaxID=114884 RepID=UPI0004828170|nr:BMP family ABC transporter substrate-binding protein [Mycoplasmopsis lipofaciens]
MKKSSKMVLTLGSIATTIAAIPMVSSACSSKISPITKKQNTGNENHPKEIAEANKVAGIVSNPEFQNAETPTEAFGMCVITDGGNINDGSFNQSAWEGLLQVAKDQKIKTDLYDVLEVQHQKFDEAYEAALNKNFKYWVLPGFLHLDPIKKFYKDNKETFQKKGIVIIGIDFLVTGEYGAQLDEGAGISLLFNTKEGGFAAGYAAAKYLSQEANENDRDFATFGGGTFPGVTDFNEGFYKGAIYWNTKNPSNKVKSTTATVDLTSGFEAKDPMATSVTKALSNNPKLVMAVAGIATNEVAKSMNDDVLLVGVDTDQSKSASKNKNRFFTSILKRIGQATYDTLGALVSGKLLNQNLGGYVAFGENNAKSGLLQKGINDNWIGLADTTLTGSERTKAEAALAEGMSKFKSLTTEELNWLHSGKVNLSDADENTDLQSRLNALNDLLKK